MKQLTIFLFVLIILLLIPVAAFGLDTPDISEHHGVITLRDVADIGLIVGGEFGITDNLAVVTDLGSNDNQRVGIKYLLDPNFAVLGGVTHTNIFLGLDFANELTDNITGIIQFDIYQMSNQSLATDYELGFKYNLTQVLDIRAGFFGTVNQTTTTCNCQVGIGFRY